MYVKFRNHSVVKLISNYCNSNNITLTISDKCDGNHYETVSRQMYIELDESKSLSYRLFIISHEYGHAYQAVNNMNNYAGSDDEEVYEKMLNGDRVDFRSKRKIIRCLLRNEFDATQIGLALLKDNKSYPPENTLRMIKRKANIQLLYHYLTLSYGYDIRPEDNFASIIELPNKFIVPFSVEFNAIIKVVKPMVHERHHSRTPIKLRDYN